jgi:hypothetical protein
MRKVPAGAGLPVARRDDLPVVPRDGIESVGPVNGGRGMELRG